jgi:ribosome recycling factor
MQPIEENYGHKVIYNFLQDLNDNNSLDCMKANKKYYEQAKMECKNLIQELINDIKAFDANIKDLLPKDLMFRLNKDTRAPLETL